MRMLWLALAFGAQLLAVCGESDQDKLEALPTEVLIDRLQRESAQGIGTDGYASIRDFVGLKETAYFCHDVLGVGAPQASGVMRELIRRGAPALDSLMAHLSDSRPSQLTVDCANYDGWWFGNEYEPRDPAKMPDGVGKFGEPRLNQAKPKYNLRVGDFCFVAIGQIVNRNLNAIRFQPTGCLVINSPVHDDALVSAVRADWLGLTPAEHAQLLRNDARNAKFSYRTAESLTRLFFYYPKEGEALTLELLQEPKPPDARAFLILASAPFSSVAVDDAVRDILKYAMKDPARDKERQIERCQIVEACAYRFIPPSRRPALLESYEKLRSQYGNSEISTQADQFCMSWIDQMVKSESLSK